MSNGSLATGILDEDPAHALGGSGEKLRTTPPRGLFFATQPKPGLVYQRRGLQRLSGAFSGHFRHGELAQLGVDQRKNLIRGLNVARIDALDEQRDFACACLVQWRRITHAVELQSNAASSWVPHSI